MTNSKELPQNSPKGLRKTSKDSNRKATNLAEILNE
jgi:hypothetical protein